ncbi:MAG: T9SS type A sorting domain-containing protein [Bacteroidales bacterium]|nr:T9SS type A sorting domain-containing protein [Bacteroidales bacterium]MCF8456430.1 T9SS type A sorting domain-containing protein [Bacteroidales bacterium]
MKRFFIALLSIFVLQTSYAQWQEIEYYPTNYRILDIASPDGQNIYFVGEEKGIILHTADMGQNWNKIETDSNHVIYAIDFPDPANGYYIDQDGLVYQSIDSGQTWKLHGFNSFIENVPKNFDMIDSMIGYSSNCYAYSFVTKTTDAGISWELLDSTLMLINDFHFINKDTGWFASPYHVYKTTNGGQTIDTISVNGTPDINAASLFFIDENNGWISAFYNTLYRTFDGGITWSLLNNQVTFDRIFFSDTLNGYGLDDEKCYITNDGGQNWQQSNLHGGIWNIELIGNNYWIYGQSGKISLSTNLNDYISIGTNLSIGSFWDLMILNDSIHCIADEYSNQLVFTENDSENYIDIATTGVSGFPNCRVVWLESRDIMWTGTDDGRLLKTIDGGLSWNVQVDLLDDQYSFLELEFTDSLHSWAIYRYSSGGHWVLRTIDGWQNWTSYEIGSTSTPSDLQFIDSLHGWFCEIAGRVHRTADGGIQWSMVDLPGSSIIRGVQFLNQQVGYAYGNDHYKTIDGGLTWETINFGYNGINDGFYLNEDTGWVMNSFEIWFTGDGGLTWISQFNAGDVGNREIEFLDENYGILIRQSNPYQTSLFKTYNGGSTWIETESVSSGHFVSIYPNPFYRNTNIEFFLNKDERISIDIFDIEGKLIDNLVKNRIFHKGKHTINLQVDSWKPGIYLCNIKMKNLTKTLRIVKVE